MTNDLLPDEIWIGRVTHDAPTNMIYTSDPGWDTTRYIRADLISAPNKTAEVDLPELLTDDERKAMLSMAEQLFSDLKENKLGGYSGINRPFWILSCFKEVIEKFGHRDVGLKWSKDMLEAAKEKHLATGKGGGEPAAPTQIDAGELEKAIADYDCASDAILGKHIDVLAKAARAHLESVRGKG